MAARRTGDWDKARRKLTGNQGARMAVALRQATIRAGLLLVREIKKGIVSQAPGGKAFEPLAESTIRRKGSSKALIDTGFLLSSITMKLLDDGVFVGLLRGTVNGDGEDIVNIGAVMEYGATIEMPNGAVVVIPARAFLGPVIDLCRHTIARRLRRAISAYDP